MATLRMERRFAASPETVFTLVTETPGLLEWWAPDGMTITGHQLDFTQPGPWSLVFTGPDGNSYPMSGTVLSVDPGRTVEFTMMAPGQPSADSTVRFEITPDGDGTLFVLTQSGLTDDMVAKGQRGWLGPLTRLEHLLGKA